MSDAVVRSACQLYSHSKTHDFWVKIITGNTYKGEIALPRRKKIKLQDRSLDMAIQQPKVSFTDDWQRPVSSLIVFPKSVIHL